MSFPRYPEYKDSGVEWLGQVPVHWALVRYKYVFDEKISVVSTTLPPGSISFGRVIFKDDEFLHEPTKATYQEVLSGEFLINPINLNYDLKSLRTALADINTCVSPAYIVLKTKVPADRNYLKYQLHIFDLFHMKTLGAGVRQTITFSDIGGCFSCLPPYTEQTQIAAFLDRETAKIDELVAEQRRLMELLKEKRQAVISHAVTKGLNPDAPMKQSGIEWLGDVPAHWEVLPFKRIVSVPITDGPHETPNFIDEGVPFVSAEAVSSGSINFSKVRACISKEDNARYSLKYAPKLHDIYMVKSGATTGITAIVEDRTDFNIWSPLAAIRCNEHSVPHFVLNFMRSKHFQEAVTLNWSFGTQQNIGMGVIENLACTVPPVSEQMEIAQLLKSESAKFDTLTYEAQRAIGLLQERRTALISAAVTGQIDVRSSVVA